MNRVLLVLAAAFLAAVMAARFAYSLSTDIGDEPINPAWSQNEMQFVTWNGERWTTWVHDGAFELIPQNTRRWHRHANRTIAFTDWDGEQWQARVDGDEFLLARRGDWSADAVRTAALRYRDWSGDHRLRTVSDLRR